MLETIEDGVVTGFDEQPGLTFPDCAHATFGGAPLATGFTVHDATG